ncbi:outer membrane protein [Acinetobacter sp. MB5]|uniref:outer membrane protein n=1 Tax=Acinetobacter sp. MB5 TaxID=2069438 RepID=UPI000DCFCEFB|nr:outer membrane protein [Acinetobacter sp. MB5]
MKKLTLSAITLSCLTISISGHTATLAESAYVSAKVGVGIEDAHNKRYSNSEGTNISGKSGSQSVFTGSIAYGFNLAPVYNIPVRAELEYSYHDTADFNFSEVCTSCQLSTKVQTVMLNGYYDFKNTSAFTPYISLGLGNASIKTTAHNDNFSKAKTTNDFAWSVGLGVGYTINPNFSIDLGYRYLDAGKSSWNNSETSVEENIKARMSSNDVTLGLRYSF